MEPGSPSSTSELDNPDERYPDQMAWYLASISYDALAIDERRICRLSGIQTLFVNSRRFHAEDVP